MATEKSDKAYMTWYDYKEPYVRTLLVRTLCDERPNKVDKTASQTQTKLVMETKFLG